MTGRIIDCNYLDNLGHQVHPVVQMLFPKNDAIFLMMTIRPCTQPEVFRLVFEEHEDALQHLL